MNAEKLTATANNICSLDSGSKRILVAIAGPPASGKSTFAEALAPEINRQTNSDTATVLPMDGFHLDNCILDQQQTRQQKGAPHTFDAQGFIDCVKRISTAKSEVFVPVFDRQLDLARAGARCVLATQSIILVEGNYLLLDQKPWSDMYDLYNYRIYLDVPESLLTERLQQRWIDHDHTPAEAILRAESNDLPNARLVASCRLDADQVITS